MPENQLQALLSSMKIGTSNDISEMVGLAKGFTDKGHGVLTGGQHYGLACQKHFDLTHPGHSTMSIAGSVSIASNCGVMFVGLRG